jgi:hypothetical protein
MTTMLEAVNDTARNELMRGKPVNLLDVMVYAQPAEGSREIAIDCRLSTELGTTPEWLANELGKIREACEYTAQDSSEDSRDVMRTTVRRRGGGFCVWMVSWPAVVLWGNFIGVDFEQFIDKSVMDAETLERVGLRMDAVKKSMGVIERRLLGGG